MRVFNRLYQKAKESELIAFIQKNNIAQYQNRALIQVFASSANREEIEELLSFFKRMLPQTPIIGVTCFGAILDGKVIEQGIVLSFCLFEDTTVKTVLLPAAQNAYQMGVEMANRLIEPETQAIVTYTDLLSLNRTHYLNGLASQKKDVVVAGGVSGHPAFELTSMVFTEAGILKEGAVAAALGGKTIQIINGYELNWVPIGRIMQVTKAEENNLIEIDGQPAAHVFKRYLGGGVLDGPIGMRATFPIIVHRSGIQIARFPFEVLASGAIVCLGDIQNGDQIQFSYGHLDTILDKNEPLAQAFRQEQIEGLFIFSCAARRVFMGDATELESLPFGNIVPVAGFFSYGEFYDVGCSIESLTNTFTYLAFSEKNDAKSNKKQFKQQTAVIESQIDLSAKAVLSVLTHLTKTFTDELTAKNAELSNAYEELVTLLEQVNAQKVEIEKQHGVIKQKNEDILDSIRYAKRIQTAFLPPLSVLQRHIPQLWLYYQPRDIVSGDFYWYAHQAPYSIIAAVDCTGHGVPGAFMTMVGNTLLNRLIIEMHLRDTAQILTELDNRVIETLKQQTSGNSKDGMDIALVVWDHSSQQLQFSGANRPLYFLRNGKVVEIKGTKFPIGDPTYNHKSFQSENIALCPGDRFYLFSDGFTDQIGGPENKKFSSRKFRDLIEQTASCVFEESNLIIKENFEQWKSGVEQLDDVCLISIET
jgi:serine phosphatase RsbU (regulator of sigma subunit)